MQLNISIPVRLTRATIYLTITAVSVLFLLPLACLTYYRFYKALIPNPLLSHELQFDYVFKNRGPFRTVNSYEFMKNLAQIYEAGNGIKKDAYFTKQTMGDFEITMQYKYETISTDSSSPNDDLVGFRFSILDDTLLNNVLKPWELDPVVVDEKSKHAKLWPVTDNLAGVTSFRGDTNQFSSDVIEWPTERSIVRVRAPKTVAKSNVTDVSKSAAAAAAATATADSSSAHHKARLVKFFSSLLSDPSDASDEGDGLSHFREGIYYTGTRWFKTETALKLVPDWIVNYFVPPFLAQYAQYNPTRDLPLLRVRFPVKQVVSGDAMKQLVEDSKHIKLIVEFANSDIYIDSAKLEFTVQFSGIRQYMYHNRFVSTVGGIAIFYMASVVVTVFVSYGLFILWRLKEAQSAAEELEEEEQKEIAEEDVKAQLEREDREHARMN